MDKAETLQQLVEQRREIQRLRKKQRRRKLWKKLNRAVSAVMYVSLAILFTLVSPVGLGMWEDGSSYEVVISEEQVQTFDQHYTTEVENGFCLYGNIEQEQVVVEKVVYVDEPRMQSRGAVSFTCVPETLDRLPQLLKQGDFGFLGIVHTHHSGSSRLSLTDAANTLGMGRIFIKVSGVYNGDEVEFYTFEDPRVAMPLQVS